MKPSNILAQLRKYLTVIKLPSNIQEKLCSFITTNPGKRKFGDSDFDIPMVCYDEAEICEFVGIFILNKLNNVIDNSSGLYRDDGLGVFGKLSWPQIEKKKKKIIKILTADFQ